MYPLFLHICKVNCNDDGIKMRRKRWQPPSHSAVQNVEDFGSGIRMGLSVHNNLLWLIMDRWGKWEDGHLCSTNHTAILTAKTINIKMASMGVINISTVVGIKVTKDNVKKKPTTVENSL